jgi:enoyl-CoA hydratase
MSEPELLVERRGSTMVVTLNRPASRNALTSTLLVALETTMAALDVDDTIASVVLTGHDPAFCAGLDLKELSTSGDNLDLEAPSRPWPRLTKPVIAAVNGPAVTGGLELVLHADIVIASHRARFADTHCRIGVMPGWGMSVLLPQAVGQRRAKEMSLTGNHITAAEAAQWGLVNRVVEHDQLLPIALALAEDVASADRSTVAELVSLHARHQDAMSAAMLDDELSTARAWAQKMVTPDAVGRRRADVEQRGREQKG